MRPDRIPLFPLNVVLLPGATLPLHIFEPRYRRMVKECLEANSEFGMLLALPNGMAGIGCTAKITEVTKRYPDGRYDILTAGGARIRIVELFTADPLLEARVDYLEDFDDGTNPRVARELIDLFETCHTLLFEDYARDFHVRDGESLAYRVADKLPLDLIWKQRILELRSEAEREERLVEYLREWAPHLQKVTGLRTKSASGGHGLN